ncbi:ABC transporter substrate-binding protein [uncultured Campylobacter sp.]|uniref:Tgt2/MlaC family protein n=1 Tax=uncultured Campylobacter sp. TaxID=218934 RepID=UPI00260EB018|nr:ABC transporter substrate-binding protein [uncultured Campylobacter sp.]
MKILKVLALCGALLISAHAISDADIEPVMSQKVAEAVGIMRSSAPKDAKPAKIFALFDGYFDYKMMAKLSLAKHYASLSPAQIEEFNKAFEAHLKRSFIEKLSLYTDQDMKVLSKQSPSDKRRVLKTQVIGEQKNYDIDFKFYPNGADWRIYDVDIVGVSLIQTYRSQLGDVTQSLGFDELIKRLNSTVINSGE